MIEIVRYTQRNVKRWQDGDMRKRWTAAGMLVAEQQFRRIIGYRDLAKLVDRDRARPRSHDRPVPDRGGRRGAEAGTAGSFRSGKRRRGRSRRVSNASAGRGRGCRGWGMRSSLVGVLVCASCGHANSEGAKFCEECGFSFAAAPAGAKEQRKTVTVLFCDLTGSTALGETTRS